MRYNSDIVIVSDAWYPQINGVVRTLDAVRTELEVAGKRVIMITPERFNTVACPGYPEIRLGIDVFWKLPRLLKELSPRYIHIATEGPLGWAARRYCMKRGWHFTTSFHTRFPEYFEKYWGVPPAITYGPLRRFHAPAATMLVTTESMAAELRAKGFKRLTLWSRGVDTKLFKPRMQHEELLPYPRPIQLYVGRVSAEKNLEAFLSLDTPGTKLVVGDGPQRAELQNKYSNVIFTGSLHGKELARYYAGADVFVFPSKSDTFGLVMLEALACGTPVAAFPVTGPRDVITDPRVGILDEDLKAAIRSALFLEREHCVRYAHRFSWAACAAGFMASLVSTEGYEEAPVRPLRPLMV